MTVPIAIATEDALSEALAVRLVAELAQPHHVAHCLRNGGAGYLRSKMSSWCQMAHRQVVFVLTDLDQVECAATLRHQWLGCLHAPDGLLLRVAVRESEAWVLSDHEAVRLLIGKKARLPLAPEHLADPKQAFLGLAKSAPKNIRADLVRESAGQLRQGLGYNTRLVDWVYTDWSPERAAGRSPSLARTRTRLREAVARFGAQGHPQQASG